MRTLPNPQPRRAHPATGTDGPAPGVCVPLLVYRILEITIPSGCARLCVKDIDFALASS